MNLNSMNSLFSLIMLVFGVYCIYAWYQLKDGTLPEKFVLLNRELPANKCLDQEQYVAYVRPRLLVFSVAMTAFGVLSVVDAQLSVIQSWFPNQAFWIQLMLTSVIPFAMVVWFAVCLHKIQKELW